MLHRKLVDVVFNSSMPVVVCQSWPWLASYSTDRDNNVSSMRPKNLHPISNGRLARRTGERAALPSCWVSTPVLRPTTAEKRSNAHLLQ